MNKKQMTMLVSIASAVLIGAGFVLSGVVNNALGQSVTSRFTSDINNIDTATKILVKIESPYGYEILRSFKVLQTDNLMQKNGYYTLRLQGPILDDKLTLMPWIDDGIGKMPDGLGADGVSIGAGIASRITEPKQGEKIDVIPMTGNVTVQLLQEDEDGAADGLSLHPLREIEYSGCHVAGYYIGTLVDTVKPYFVEGIQHYEEVVFACNSIKNLDFSGKNNRGILVERSIQGSNETKINEKGELIVKSDKYRQPIVIQGSKSLESKQVKQGMIARILTDKTYYRIGDTATFSVTFTDIEGNAIDPDVIRSYYNGKMVVLERKDSGIYNFTTPPLSKEHQQLIVSAEKKDFPTKTTYLSIHIQRIG